MNDQDELKRLFIELRVADRLGIMRLFTVLLWELFQKKKFRAFIAQLRLGKNVLLSFNDAPQWAKDFQA